MRVCIQMVSVIGAAASLAILAGCSGGSQVAPTPLGSVPGGAAPFAVRDGQDPRLNGILALHEGNALGHSAITHGFMRRDAIGKALLFASTGNDVDIYLQRGKQKLVGQITGLEPGGLAADSAGNVYVANYANSTVPVYAAPYTGSPTFTLSDTGYFPSGVAVSNAGIVGVANSSNVNGNSLGTYGPGSVNFYANHSTTPCATVSDPKNFPSPFSAAFDNKGNLYIVGFSSAGAIIGEIVGGCDAKKISLLTLPPSVYVYPFSIQVDKANRIALLARGGSTYDDLDLFKTPRHGSLGSPVSIVELVTPAYPFAFAFSASNADVFTVEQGSGGLANTYDFPSGGSFEKTITVGGAPQGVAVVPVSR